MLMLLTGAVAVACTVLLARRTSSQDLNGSLRLPIPRPAAQGDLVMLQSASPISCLKVDTPEHLMSLGVVRLFHD
jgi:hypothetical protein